VAEVRVGLGFDVHLRAPGRPLFLGAVAFEGEEGLAGHSDGDVVCHALADALLGASALGDIGEHFPDTEPASEGIAGDVLLARVREMVGERDHRVRSVDVTVIAMTPAISPRRDEIRARLAALMGLDEGHVAVKATRPEGLGLTGVGIGCLALAVLETP
jgi:2-C-methyl-D-erythritol 2,4-cyclodiphosphate synthase